LKTKDMDRKKKLLSTRARTGLKDSRSHIREKIGVKKTEGGGETLREGGLATHSASYYK